MYVKELKPNNAERFVKKFEKDIEYGNKYFPELAKVYMLWSPIVKTSKEGSLYNQQKDIAEVKRMVYEKYNVNL